jgi:hypothetical protein
MKKNHETQFSANQIFKDETKIKKINHAKGSQRRKSN